MIASRDLPICVRISKPAGKSDALACLHTHQLCILTDIQAPRRISRKDNIQIPPPRKLSPSQHLKILHRQPRTHLQWHRIPRPSQRKLLLRQLIAHVLPSVPRPHAKHLRIRGDEETHDFLHQLFACWLAARSGLQAFECVAGEEGGACAVVLNVCVVDGEPGHGGGREVEVGGRGCVLEG